MSLEAKFWSALQIARPFRHAGFIQELDGSRWTKTRPVLQYPNDFFVGCHFDELRAFAVTAERANDRVTVGQSHRALSIDEPIGLG